MGKAKAIKLFRHPHTPGRYLTHDRRFVAQSEPGSGWYVLMDGNLLGYYPTLAACRKAIDKFQYL